MTAESDQLELTPSASQLLHLLRAVASQAVLVGHGLAYFGIAKLPWIQNSGVCLFFVLSGLVIPYSAYGKRARSGAYGFGAYFIDRFARIYAGLVPALFFILAIDLLQRDVLNLAYWLDDSLNTRTFFGNLFMLQRFPFVSLIPAALERLLGPDLMRAFRIEPFGSGRPLWTVSIEWWIYMLFGWIVLQGGLRRSRPFVYYPLLVFLMVVPLAYISWLSAMWLMGVAIYAGLKAKRPVWRYRRLTSRSAITLSVCFLALAFTRLWVTRQAYDLPYVALLALSLFSALTAMQRIQAPWPQPLARSIVFVADFSYMLYLIHHSVLSIWVTKFGPGPAQLFLAVLLSNGAAVAMHVVFDRNYRRVALALQRRLELA